MAIGIAGAGGAQSGVCILGRQEIHGHTFGPGALQVCPFAELALMKVFGLWHYPRADFLGITSWYAVAYAVVPDSHVS